VQHAGAHTVTILQELPFEDDDRLTAGSPFFSPTALSKKLRDLKRHAPGSHSGPTRGGKAPIGGQARSERTQRLAANGYFGFGGTGAALSDAGDSCSIELEPVVMSTATKAQAAQVAAQGARAAQGAGAAARAATEPKSDTAGTQESADVALPPLRQSMHSHAVLRNSLSAVRDSVFAGDSGAAAQAPQGTKAAPHDKRKCAAPIHSRWCRFLLHSHAARTSCPISRPS
jgi:hypothetical protein